MKTAFLSLFFFLFAFANAQLLVDTDGDFVKNGGIYHIVPAVSNGGGGLRLARARRETCPLYVAQDFYENALGFPTKITALGILPFLTTGLNVNLQFMRVPDCGPQPSMWYVTGDSEFKGSVKVTSNRQLIGNFQFQKAYKDAYKLTYCTGLVLPTCSDLGISYDALGNRRLAVNSGNQFLLKLKKANTQYLEKLSSVS